MDYTPPMFERDKFDYTPLYSDNPNILIRIAKGANLGGFPGALHPVLSTLSRRHKDWTFIGHSQHNSCKVWVYADGEGLGWFLAYGSNLEISIDSQELSNKRFRGQCNRTKDPKKAIKLIEENFKPLSNEAVLRGHFGKGQEQVSGLFYTAQRKVASILNGSVSGRDVNRACLDYAVKGITTSFPEYLNRLGFPADTFSNLVSARENLDFIIAFSEKSKQTPSVLVVNKGHDKYLMAPMKSLEDHITGPLPEAYKQAVGFLKLSEVGVPLMEYGMRISETSFLIWESSNEES